ncbi:hypothetical protein LIN78_10985 [Leeia sp. TBRC 13508]|uniref:Uncharacterized protein n=1 Tax=Leeia speluncae TaxID=2884804 RepID=A0ABS8D792_9NEIS|nr:hypothetical protein [Leeia speluncae]MCB6184070.1 hypothetical protein [Leeia speluncae]
MIKNWKWMLLSWLICLPAFASNLAVSTPSFLVKQFGYYADNQFIESDNVPYVIGQDYGWRMQVTPNIQSIWIEEKFTLPKAPATWGDDVPSNNFRISADRKTATVRLNLFPQDGWIYHDWTIAKGDPTGQHQINVFYNGKLIAAFPFEIQANPKGEDQ